MGGMGVACVSECDVFFVCGICMYLCDVCSCVFHLCVIYMSKYDVFLCVLSVCVCV